MREVTRVALILLAAMMTLMSSRAATAHHSGAIYDSAKTITLHGTLQKVQISNPHSWLWLVVDKGSAEQDVWALESHSATVFVKRYGARAKQELTVGQKVTVTIHPLRDGRMSGSVISVVLANGKVFN